MTELNMPYTNEVGLRDTVCFLTLLEGASFAVLFRKGKLTGKGKMYVEFIIAFGSLENLFNEKMSNSERDIKNYTEAQYKGQGFNVVKDVIVYRKTNNVVRKDFLQLLIHMKNRHEEDGVGGIPAQPFTFAGNCVYEVWH
ncbi:hypothetical protein NQ318_004956 [Aromia moschata]|uniref:Uncharacterized protein n=1 Tax=Aromia moschata TaxID=1265417 RepID=A0AAV8XC68_9CUCU|nr:hypothetical protein NQ318_004956 [Aromia moschata]